MKHEATSEILRFIPKRLVWCDRSTLLQVCRSQGCPQTEIDAAINYLASKSLLTRQVVNLPGDELSGPFYRKVTGEPNEPVEPKTIAQQLRQQLNNVMRPTEMIGASKLWAGMAGAGYLLPADHPTWFAYFRLAHAMAVFHAMPGFDLSNWKVRPSRAAHPSALFATYKEKVLCVPVRVDRPTIDRLVGKLEQAEYDYEIW